jgi:hypothetical protein
VGTDSRTLSLVTWNSWSPLCTYNGFERSKESIRYCWEEDTCDFNNASETWNRRLESWKPNRSYGLKQHWSINYPWFKGTEGPITITDSIKWNCERPYHAKDTGTAQISVIRQGVLKLVYSIVSEGKPVTGPLMIQKAKSFQNKIKITDKCKFSDGSNKNYL